MSRIQRSHETSQPLFIPYLALILLVVMDSVPTNIGGLERMELGLYFVPLFFICVSSESDLTPVSVAFIGILNDLMSETPVGYWAFLFVAFYMLCASQRTILQNASFGSYWLTFSILLSLTYATAYIIAFVRDDMLVAALPLFTSVLMSGLFFPLVYGPFHAFRDFLLRGDRS